MHLSNGSSNSSLGSKGKDSMKNNKQKGFTRSVDLGDGTNHEYYRSFDSDEAETELVKNIEERRHSSSTTSSDGFQPAVKGERPPLGINNLGSVFAGNQNDAEEGKPSKRPDFKSMANRVRTLQRMSHFNRQSSERSINTPTTDNSHRRAQSLLASIDESPEPDDKSGTEDKEKDTAFIIHRHEGSRDLGHLDTIFDFDNSESDFSHYSDIPVVVESDPNVTPEGRPLLEDQSTTNLPGSPSSRPSKNRKIKRRWKKLKACLNPATIPRRLCDWFKNSFLLFAFPCWIIAWFLFYYDENVELDFLPGNATLSWWFNFFGRQLLLLELASILQYVLVDCLALSTKIILNFLGPWVTLVCLQSRGWPFLIAGWGILDMCLLHGDNQFQQHWLYFSGIEIYSSGNSGSYILQSDRYLRVLIGLVVAGVATSMKRTIVTLYFGKRNLEVYKPQLEDILSDIIVITEVAELAVEADHIEEDEASQNKEKVIQNIQNRRDMLGHARWSSLRFKKEETRARAYSEDPSPLDMNNDTTASPPVSLGRLPYEKRKEYTGNDSNESSRLLDIKNLLDRWEEPVSKLDKSADASVDDILKFRKALTYMDLEFPFSEAFGPASNRNELIASAEKNYGRLLKLSPGSTLLPFSVISVLSESDDGTVDRDKRRSLLKLYRPDVDDEITLLSFIQSCDSVYKKLRYFRASVGNASVIDKKLEDIINALYYFVLVLMVLLLLNFNPWPMLVSMSTLLVTFAFALGPSAAKAIEGILLVIGRRPFDIGDRILISDSPGGGVPDVAMSWMVEDITLFSTTVRFGGTNEIATITNGSIAASRITNFARSKNAIVHLFVKLDLSFHVGGNVDMMRESLDNYIHDNRHIYDSIVFFRCEEIDTDNGFLRYRLAVRSRHTWQVASRVLTERASLHQFMVELAKKMNVLYSPAEPTQTIFYGGKRVNAIGGGSTSMGSINQVQEPESSSENIPRSNSSGHSGKKTLAEIGAEIAGDSTDPFLTMLREANK